MDAVLKMRDCIRVGATAVNAFVRTSDDGGRVLTVANCGDARAVMSRAGRPFRLTTDHRPVNTERRRVETSGGFVSCGRVNGILNVSRAFGDHCMKSLVICTPAVFEVKVTSVDQFVVLACDGLWDFVDDDTVVQSARDGFERGLTSQQVSQELVQLAMKSGSTDNCSVLVLVFDTHE